MFATGFQSFAFQTTGNRAPTGGHFLPIYENKKRKKRIPGNIAFIYDSAIDSDEAQELAAIVKPYMMHPLDEEAPKPSIINFNSIDYEALEANAQAYENFFINIDKLLKNIELIKDQQDEDELLLQITIIACTIN